jgi:TRAP-type uncharacterized transport system substrate-binding protein
MPLSRATCSATASAAPCESCFGGKQHPSAECRENTFLPFHLGAVRYNREIGIGVPESLVPTN